MEGESLRVKGFFNDVMEGEEIRISSGEGYWRIIEGMEEELTRISGKTKISIIVGPIVSVDDEHEIRNDGNPYIRLLKAGKVSLYCPPCRQRFHFKIKGGRLVLKEDYHLPQATRNERVENLIDNPLLVNTYIRDFDYFIEEFKLEEITKDNRGNHFIYLNEEEIEKLKRNLVEDPSSSPLELGLKYDFLIYNEVIDLLKRLGIFKDEMITS